MDEQAAYVIQAFALARAAGVERMSIYKLVDEARRVLASCTDSCATTARCVRRSQSFQTAVRYMSAPTSAVYTWEGASDPPTDDQLTRLIQSNANRTQWIWPAAVNRVTMERGAGARDRRVECVPETGDRRRFRRSRRALR